MALILAIDDARTMRELVRTILESEGHTVLTADDGVTGELLANEHKADLVITDIHMDEMDGITLTAKLRKLVDYKTTPILMLTTEISDEKKIASRAAGASGWLNKPFSPPRLIRAVNKLLDL
ncbi:MAG: response regulator [Gammaproteobacteria bacterium]|nr:MAG: response regulator [Gammaproteobacteria bacterium]